MSNIIERIIASKRLPTLFIGAGLSKRYLENYPSWEQLLELLRQQIGLSSTAFAAKKHEFISQNVSITKGLLNQKMASYLQSVFLRKIENDEIDLTKLFSNEEIVDCVENGTDYFKKLVAKHFATYRVDTSMKEEIELFRKICEKTSMVFTTNYDLFLQSEIFRDYKVYDSQDKYYFRTSNGYGELFKIHGCITSPNSIIICENDYCNFSSSLKLVSSKLLNALLDYPVIFLGYSLEDENIKSIMTDFVNSFSETILQEVKNYILLVIFEKGQMELVEGEKQFTDSNSGKSITLTTIKTDNFKKLFDYINQLAPSATTYELRKYKTMIADLINKTAKGQKKVYVQELDDAKADALAVYIGSKSSIEGIQKSIVIYENSDIIKKALNEEEFDYDSLALKWYDSKGIASTEYTPIYYILQKMSVSISRCGLKFRKNLEAKERTFGSLSYSSGAASFETIQGLYQKFKTEGKSAISISTRVCKELEIALFHNKISIQECHNMLKQMLCDYPDAVSCSPFKRCACYMWYIEQKKSTEG